MRDVEGGGENGDLRLHPAETVCRPSAWRPKKNKGGSQRSSGLSRSETHLSLNRLVSQGALPGGTANPFHCRCQKVQRDSHVRLADSINYVANNLCWIYLLHS